MLFSFIFTFILLVDQLLPGEKHLFTLYDFVPYWIGNLFILVAYLQFPVVMALERVKSWKLYASLLAFPLFLMSWYPITFHAFFTQNNKQWSHTQHTRVLKLDDVQKF